LPTHAQGVLGPGEATTQAGRRGVYDPRHPAAASYGLL